MWLRTLGAVAIVALVAGCTATDSARPGPEPAEAADPAPAETESMPAEEAPVPTEAPPTAERELREGTIEIELVDTHPDNIPPEDHEQYGFSSSSNAQAVGNLLRFRLLDGDQPVNASWDLGDGTQIAGRDEVEHRYLQEGWYMVKATGVNVTARQDVPVFRYTFLSGTLPPCPTCEVSNVTPLPHASPPTRFEIHVSNATYSVRIDTFSNRAEPWFILYDENGEERGRPRPLGGLTTFWSYGTFADVEPGGDRTWYLDVWGRAGVPDASFGAQIRYF